MSENDARKRQDIARIADQVREQLFEVSMPHHLRQDET